MHGRLMVLRVHTNIMGSRGYLVFRHAIMAQEDEGTLECNTWCTRMYLLYMIYPALGAQAALAGPNLR